MREKDRLLRQEAAAEAVLFTMGRAVELRELSAALETGEEEAQAAVERLRENTGKRAEASPLSSFPEASRCVRRQNTMKI